MKLPKLPRPMPQAAGFNRRRIAAAVIVVAGLLGAVTILLTRGLQREIVRTEPAVTAASTREPLELLEEPPPEPERIEAPVLFERQIPAETPPQPMAERKVSARVQRAFSEPIPHASRRRSSQRIPGERPDGGSVLPPELSAMFQDIDEQGRSLTRLLEQSPVVGGGAGPSTPGSGGGLNAPPPTVHREARRQAPSPYLLSQGTLIGAQLLTEINSDLPGQVLAVVSRDVLDSVRSRHVLIPRGSRIVGEYASGLDLGQNRLAVAWKRFLLPDGSSIDVDGGGFPAVDAQGRSGLHDRVNHHTARVFGNALVLSLVSAGFAAAQPDGGGLRLSTGALAVQGAATELEQAAGELLRRRGAIPPTVRIRAGQRLNVFLTGDLSFAAPYS